MERRAHPPSGGARWNSETRCPGFLSALGSPSLRVASATGPPTSGRRSGWTSSEVHVRNLLRNATPGRGSAAMSVLRGRRGTVSIHRRSLEATRLRSEGFAPGTTSARPRAVLFGGRQTVGPESGSSSSRFQATTHLSGSLRSSWGWRTGSVGRGPTSCRPAFRVRRGRTLRGATTEDKERSSLVSFGTRLPTSNVPIRVRRTTDCVIFGWQRKWPRPLETGAKAHSSRHLRVAKAVDPSVQPGAMDQRQSHLSGGKGVGLECPFGCNGPKSASSSGGKDGGPEHSTRVQRTNASAIFGWQRRRPRALDPGTADTGSLSFGRAKPGWERLTGCAGSSRRTLRSVKARCSA
jgi:hypothetical protein